MAALMTFLCPIILGLLTHEIIAHAPSISKWLVSRAVLQLKAESRERYLAEWLAVIDDLPGVVRKLRFGFGIFFSGARRVERVLRRRHPLQLPLVRASAMVIGMLALNVGVLHKTVPFVLKQLIARNFRNIKFAFISQKILVRTSLLSIMKNHSQKEATAALAASAKNIQEILENKEPGSGLEKPTEN